MFNKILVALDGSDHAKKALDTAIQLAQRCDAELVLFHAVQLSGLSPGYAAMVSRSAREVYEKIAYEQADAILDEAVAAAAVNDIERRTRLTLLADSAAGAILDASAEAGIELIVVGTRGLTGLREIAMGSVAHKVASAAACPVLVVR